MMVVVLVSVAVIVFSFAHSLGYDPSYQQFIKDISGMLSIVTDGGYGVAIHWMIYIIFLLILSPIAGISILFGALTIGQLAGKMRGLFGIIAYFVILFVTSILGSLAQVAGAVIVYGADDYSTAATVHLEQFFSRDINVIIIVLVGVILYFVSHYIITEKLNLQ